MRLVNDYADTCFSCIPSRNRKEFSDKKTRDTLHHAMSAVIIKEMHVTLYTVKIFFRISFNIFFELKTESKIVLNVNIKK